MIYHGKTKSAIMPEPFRVDEHSVWVHTNITPFSIPAEDDGDGGAGVEGWEFSMIQYTKDEFIQILAENVLEVVDTPALDTIGLEPGVVIGIAALEQSANPLQRRSLIDVDNRLRELEQKIKAFE